MKGILGENGISGKGFICPAVVGAGKRFFPDRISLCRLYNF